MWRNLCFDLPLKIYPDYVLVSRKCKGKKNPKIYPNYVLVSRKRNFIYIPFIYLYTPLKIPIEENTNLSLNIFFLFFFSSSSSLCAP